MTGIPVDLRHKDTSLKGESGLETVKDSLQVSERHLQG
jgi:hypothetical protein